jgi:hypothetical protein
MDRWSRLAPLNGVIFVALLVASFAIGGSSPGVEDPGSKVIAFFKEHQNAQRASALFGALAVVFFLFFAGVVRAHLRRSDRVASLAATGFGGAILIAVGGASFSAFGFALADAPDKLSPAAAQAINLLSNDFFFPFAAGIAVFMIANGLAVARSALLPRWLGWVALLIGVLAVTPIGFVAFFALMAWVLVVAILLFVRSGPPLPGGTATSAG